MNFDLGSINLRQIPLTKALLEQKIRSFEPMDSWWFTKLNEGTITRDRDGWEVVVYGDEIYEDYVRFAEQSGIRRKAERPTFFINLGKLVPGLKRGNGVLRSRSHCRH